MRGRATSTNITFGGAVDVDVDVDVVVVVE